MYYVSVLSIEVDQAAGETASTRHHTTVVPVPVRIIQIYNEARVQAALRGGREL